MKVLIVGGGSGGHITPTLAVATELKKNHPDCQIDYVIGKRDKLVDVARQHKAINHVHEVYSGKFRRYNGAGLRQVLDIPTTLKNIRDLVYVKIGIIQSFILLRRLKPDAVFIKGGFVGVPVGLAAALLKIPYITHDSDAIPGLANRIIGRWAWAHAVAMPKENYKYPKGRTYQVGIPISKEYSMINAAKQKNFKESFGLSASSPVLMITGGGLGAQRLNLSIAKVSSKLLNRHKDLVILHIAGRGKEQELSKAYHRVNKQIDLTRIIIEPFVSDLHRYSGAADVVVVRASATTLAELAVQAKACIVVPNDQLTGGHQTKNAEILAQQKAIINISDKSVTTNPELLLQQIELLLNDPKSRLELARNLHGSSDTDAAKKLSELIIKCVNTSQTEVL